MRPYSRPIIVAAVGLSILLSLSFVPPARADITVQPGPIFAMPCGGGGGCANLTFAAAQTFVTSITFTNAYTLALDSTTLVVQKYPNAYPSVSLNFSVYNPAGSAGVIFDMIASLSSGTDLWINVSGLNSVLFYQFSANAQKYNQALGPSASVHVVNFPLTTDIVLRVGYLPFQPVFPSTPMDYTPYVVWGVFLVSLVLIAVAFGGPRRRRGSSRPRGGRVPRRRP